MMDVLTKNVVTLGNENIKLSMNKKLEFINRYL
jgi:hypothetical protein